jgi:hypothetical protein
MFIIYKKIKNSNNVIHIPVKPILSSSGRISVIVTDRPESVDSVRRWRKCKGLRNRREFGVMNDVKISKVKLGQLKTVYE